MAQDFKRLTDHLWVGQSEIFATNHGIFISEGQACLIDPGVLPEEIEATAAFVQGQGAEVRTIILTHSHWDHIFGPEHFPDAKVVAHEQYLASVAGEHGDELRERVATWEAEQGIERAGDFVIPEPDMVFEGTMTLTVGDLVLRLSHAPGHTVDQLVVYQPESQVLWAADMLSDIELPMAMYSFTAYEQTLRRLAELEVRALIPGHGFATTSRDAIGRHFEWDINYLAETRRRVADAIRAGKDAEATIALCHEMQYPHRKDYQGVHELNVGSAYIELGGEADAGEVGWGQV